MELITKFDTHILKLDTDIIEISYSTKNNYCIYNYDSLDNPTENLIEKINNKFKKNYQVNKIALYKRVINLDTLYKGYLNIYMNNLITTEIYVRFLKSNSKVIKIPYCFYVDNPWNSNFAHLIFELLYPILKLNALDSNTPILISTGSYTYKLLKLLNIKNPIIERKEENVYCIEDAIYMSCPHTFSRKTISFVKKNINNYIEKYRETCGKPKGVIIKRNGQRIILNYDVFINEIIKTFDWIEWLIYDDREDFDDYFKKFINVSYIVGPHGAGLANMIFTLNPKVKVFELMINDFINPCFKDLAEYLDIEFHTLLLNNDQYLNTVLNIDLILEILNKYIRNNT